MSLQRFEAEQLAGLDTLQVHEDYNDWYFWQAAQDEKQRLLSDVQRVKVV